VRSDWAGYFVEYYYRSVFGLQQILFFYFYLEIY